MSKYSYVVKSGETPADVAYMYTGNRLAYRDIIDMNPHVGTATDSCGALVFDPRDWHEGLKVYIPARWAQVGQKFSLPQTRFLGGPRVTGLLGASDDPEYPGDGYGTKVADPAAKAKGTGKCTKTRDTDVKPYEFEVQGETLEQIAQGWLPSSWQRGTGLYTTRALIRVNYDRMDSDCENGWLQNGINYVRIPAKWPECPLDWKDRRVNSDGTAYVDVEPPAPKPPGEDPVDRVPPGVDTVGAGDSDSSTLWMLLAAGAAVAGGIYLYNAKKKGGRSA